MDMEEAASHFCRLIETAPTHARDVFIEKVVPALTAIIEAGSTMPRIDLTDSSAEDDYEPPEIPHDLWLERFAGVGQVLADWQHYLTVDPVSVMNAAGAEVMVGDLNDDLADTWRDLKEGLIGLEQGGPGAEIRWHWRWGYYNHWGTHATQALAVLHARLREIEARRTS